MRNRVDKIFVKLEIFWSFQHFPSWNTIQIYILKHVEKSFRFVLWVKNQERAELRFFNNQLGDS